MVNIINTILYHILTAVYESFWFSVLIAVLLMFLVLYVREHGGDMAALREAMRNWKDMFLHSHTFRRLFLLAIYTAMILFRTLLNRSLWLNPLSDIMGGWSLIDENGMLTTEPIENLMLFIPFTVLLFWALKKRLIKGRLTLSKVLVRSGKIVFCFSLTIELLQLFLRLGTFQLSDLFLNTLGGCIGGFIYWIGYRLFFDHKERKG